MDDNNDSAKEVTEQPESKPEKAKGGIGPVLIFLLSLVALVIALTVGYLGYQQLQNIGERLSTLEIEKNNNEAFASNLNKNLTSQINTLKNQLQAEALQNRQYLAEQITSTTSDLAAIRRTMSKVSGRHQSDWLLAEADYLVRLAATRLALEKDHLTALALLISADERLLMMDDPAMQDIREVISSDIAKLRLVKNLDTSGIAARISALHPQLNSLPMMTLVLPEEVEHQSETTTTNEDPSWYDNLKNTLSELSKKWFVVRDHGRPVMPLMDPQFEQLIRNNLMLLVQTAQYAVLRSEAELYESTLLQLKSLSVEYFDSGDDGVALFLVEIEKLAALKVEKELPERLDSRLMLSREVESRLQKAPLDIPGNINKKATTEETQPQDGSDDIDSAEIQEGSSGVSA